VDEIIHPYNLNHPSFLMSLISHNIQDGKLLQLFILLNGSLQYIDHL